MERRHFISGAAGATATVAGAVAPHPAHAAIPPGVDLGNFVARLDRTLDALTNATLCDLTPPDGESAKWSRYEVLCRKSLRSLHLVSTLHDLPRDVQRDPRIQERMWAALPEMDDAVFGMAEALDEIGEDGVRELRDTFLNDADVRAQTMERFYSGIEAADISEERLERSRSLMRQIHRELGRKNPSGIVADSIHAIRRLERVRHLGVEEWTRAVEETDSARRPTESEEEWTPPPDRVLRAGCWTMGIGLAAGVGGFGLGYLVGSCEVACVGVGIGALLLVVGLGILIVGAIRRSVRRAQLEP